MEDQIKNIFRMTLVKLVIFLLLIILTILFFANLGGLDIGYGILAFPITYFIALPYFAIYNLKSIFGVIIIPVAYILSSLFAYILSHFISQSKHRNLFIFAILFLMSGIVLV